MKGSEGKVRGVSDEGKRESRIEDGVLLGGGGPVEETTEGRKGAVRREKSL